MVSGDQRNLHLAYLNTILWGVWVIAYKCNVDQIRLC